MEQVNPTVYKVEVSPLAREQVDKHCAWIGVDIPAQLWMDGIFQAMETLAMWPKAHAFAQESEAFGFETRKLTFKQHVILFYVNEVTLTVEVIAVKAGRMRRGG